MKALIALSVAIAFDGVLTERFAGQQGFSRRAPRQPKPRSATAAAIPSFDETNQTSRPSRLYLSWCPSWETLLAGVPLDVRERIRIGTGPNSGTTPTTNAIRAINLDDVSLSIRPRNPQGHPAMGRRHGGRRGEARRRDTLGATEFRFRMIWPGLSRDEVLARVASRL